MNNVTWKDRFRYRFDNFMSKGAGALIFGLFLLTAAIAIVATFIILFFGIGPEGEGTAWTLWGTLMRLMDAGTVAGDMGNWPYLFLMLAVTMGGIFIFSTLIGVLTTGLEDKLDQLRKGRSFVAETGHTVILGWSPQIFSVVSELVLANESLSKACIVIMADKDKVEMEDEIRDKIVDTKTTKIVCRTGDPIDLDDLEIINPSDARSIIVMPEDNEDADASVLKTVMALNAKLGNSDKGPHMTAVIRNKPNLRAARIAGGKRTVFLSSTELIARIMAQTCRQSGLSMALTEIIAFSGSEIYFYGDDRLTGKTYKQALHAFDTSAVMGLCRNGSEIMINPPMETVIAAGDEIICLSEDDDTIAASLAADKDPGVDASLIALEKGSPRNSERTLVLGWNPLGAPLVTNLDGYVAKGSELQVVAINPPDQEILGSVLSNMELSCLTAIKSDRVMLDKLDFSRLDQVVILCRKDLPANLADADTLATLLHVRDIAENVGRDFPIITEILDSRTQELAKASRADDFIVSDRLVSLLLAQVSEKPELAKVFDELFSPEGMELYIKPVPLYIRPDQPTTFHTLVEAAAQRKETVVGYRLGAHSRDPEENFGVRLNPPKSDTYTLTPHDSLIVIADDEL